jgi:hypothetical protein
MKDKTTWEPKGVIITFSDVVDGEELFQANEELYADERFDNIHYQIFDFTKVTEFKVEIDWITKLAAWDKAAALSNPNMKVATVATDEVTQMLSSLYSDESLESSWETQMFISIDEAQQWVL